jgi:hypothetical protein
MMKRHNANVEGQNEASVAGSSGHRIGVVEMLVPAIAGRRRHLIPSQKAGSFCRGRTCTSQEYRFDKVVWVSSVARRPAGNSSQL